jgi:hypothetical protein
MEKRKADASFSAPQGSGLKNSATGRITVLSICG